MMADITPPKKAAPKQVANAAEAEESIKNLDEPIVIDESEPKVAKKPRHHRIKEMWAGWSKRKRILVIALSLVLLAALTTALVLAVRPKKHLIPRAPAVSKTAKPVTVASPLSGIQVPPEMAQRPVTAVMIENSTDARPQAGLQDAGVVFEAIAEGGVTRFCALFQEARPVLVGPVRSLRPYYIDWFTPFDASIAHVGGSPDALNQIRSGGKDLDQFFNSQAYWRVDSRDAPHNVYTNFDKLDDLNQAKGYITSKVQGFPRKADSPFKTPNPTSIDFAISGPVYNPHYDYNPATNNYARSEGGGPHLDIVNTAGVTDQLRPKVVIAMIVPLGQGALDASGAYYSDYSPNGSGQVYVFQDGGLTTGTWTKVDRASQITFADANGAPIKLDAGQTWITALSAPGQVSYK